MRTSLPKEPAQELVMEAEWERGDGLQPLSLSIRVLYLLLGKDTVASLVTL